MAAAPPEFISQDQLLDEQPDLLLLTDLQGQVVFANLTARQLWQLKVRELSGQSIWQLLQCDNLTVNLLQELTSRMGAGDQLRLRMTAPRASRWRKLLLDTRICPFVTDQQPLLLFSCRPLPEGVSELAIEPEDSPSNPDLANVFNNLRDYFLRIDHRGGILLASPNLPLVLGLHEEQQLRSYSIRRFIDDDQWQQLQDVIDSTKGYCEELELRFTTKAGEVLIFSFNASVWHHDDMLVGGLEGTLRNITERHHGQQQLTDSEIRYRTLFDKANDAIFLMRHRTVIDLNQRALELFQCDRETLIGTEVDALSPLLQPDDRNSAKFIEKMLNQVADGHTEKFEWRGQRADQTPLDLEISLSQIVLADGTFVIALMRDITQRLANEAALRQSEQMYNTIVSNSGDGIVIVTPDQKIAFVNQRIHEITGFTKQQIIGSRYLDFLEVEDPEQSQKILADLFLNQGSIRTERKVRNVDNQSILMDIKSTLIQYNGKQAMVSFLRDVTAEHLAADELRDHRTQLEQLVSEKTKHLLVALAEAEAANQAKSRFLANISHELRTPLHAVLAYAEFGESRALDGELEKLQQYFNRIQSSGKRLLLLMNNLLDLSQLEAGQLTLSAQPCNIQLLVEKVIDDMQLKLGDHPVTTNLANQTEPVVVSCDFDRICQVVAHLLANALQFSSDTAPVEITLSQNAKRVLVLVRDHGVGLINEEISSLFTPFTESSQTRSEAGGTGLGLAISKQIIDGHNGTINGFNNRDGGATFYFTLPRATEPLTKQPNSDFYFTLPRATEPLTKQPNSE